MSDEYHVVWTDTAGKDLKAIIEYIAADRPAAALQNYRKIREKAALKIFFSEN